MRKMWDKKENARHQEQAVSAAMAIHQTAAAHPVPPAPEATPARGVAAPSGAAVTAAAVRRQEEASAAGVGGEPKELGAPQPPRGTGPLVVPPVSALQGDEEDKKKKLAAAEAAAAWLAQQEAVERSTKESAKATAKTGDDPVEWMDSEENQVDWGDSDDDD